MAVLEYNFKRAKSVQFNGKNSKGYYEFIGTSNIIGKTDNTNITPLYGFSIEFEIASSLRNGIIPIFGTKLGLSCWFRWGTLYLYENITSIDDVGKEFNKLYSIDVNFPIKTKISLLAKEKDEKGYISYFVSINLFKEDELYRQVEFDQIIKLTYPIQSNSSEDYYNFIGAVNGINTQAEGLRIYSFKMSVLDKSSNIVDYYYVPGYCTKNDIKFITFEDKSKIYNVDGECKVAGSGYEVIAQDVVSPHYSVSEDSSKATIDYSTDLESVTNLTIKEGSVAKIQDKNGQVLWEKAKHKYGNNAYGIRWKNSDVANVERVGNMELHKTLPIQTRFKTCCFNHIDGTILYADPNDRRFATEDNYVEGSEFIFDFGNNYLSMDTENISDIKYYIPFGKPDGFIDCPMFTDDMSGLFMYNYIVIEELDSRDSIVISKIAFVQGFDMESKRLYYKYLSGVQTTAGSYLDTKLRIKLGFPTNGYYGSVMVDTGGSFYLWSEEAATDDDYNYVWISEEAPKDVDALYIPRMLVSADTVAIKSKEIVASDKNSNIGNDYWGYLGNLDDQASICCRNFSPELRGGDGNINYDFMLNPIDSDKQPMDYWQALSRQGKPQGNKIFIYFSNAHDLNGMTGLSYVTYKAIFWLYTIEYASFNCTQNYQLPENSLKQGGLGEDVVTHCVNKSGKNWANFNAKNPINMCLSSFDIGMDECYSENEEFHYYRNDGICDATGTKYTSPKAYRGIEWLFGDRGMFLENVGDISKTGIIYEDFECNDIIAEGDLSSGNFYINSFELGKYAELLMKASTNKVSDSIGYSYVSTYSLLFIWKNSNYTSLMASVASTSDQGVENYLGSVQQMIIE